MAKLSPIGNVAQFINGVPAVGAKLFTYAAGSSTKQTTYTDEAGTIPQTNPIILDSRGEPTQPIWLTEGLSYDFVFTASTDSDPPTSPIWDVPDVTGINDSSITISQWVDSGFTPTYVSATQFTVPGDQTSTLTVGRRIKVLVTAGTAYGYISASVFGALTTVTVVMDSTPLDSGLSSVQLGLLTPNNTSLFLIQNSNLADAYISDLTAVTIAANDYLAIADTSDSNKKKKALVSDIVSLGIIRGFLNGFSPSTAGSSTTLTVGAGQATDSTQSTYLSLASAIAKTTAAWSVGTAQGGLDTGAIANNTTYHWYVIRRPDTGVVDVIFSTSAASPTLPANYTQYRYLFPMRTNGSAQWVGFTYDNNLGLFRLSASVLDVNTTNPGTSAVTATLASIPTGINVGAYFNYGAYDPTNANSVAIYFSDLAANDEAVSTSAAPLASSNSVATSSVAGLGNQVIRTNTSSQIRYRINVAGATVVVRIATLGWYYRLGTI
jgi:hypothetical protein